MPWEADKHSNLGEHAARRLPPGHDTKAFRIAGPAELLIAFGRLTPEARGRVLAIAMRAKGKDD